MTQPKQRRTVPARGLPRCDAEHMAGGSVLRCVWQPGHVGRHRANGYEWDEHAHPAR